MGCWNETCGFSQQSILCGDLVYAFIIINNDTPSKSVYANGIAFPMSFPITAQYNDYGSIENAKTDFATESTIRLFNKYYRSGKLIVNYESSDSELYKDIESIFYDIERGNVTLKLRNFRGKDVEHGLSFMLIKKKVLETAWNVIEESTDYDVELNNFENFKDDIGVMLDDCVVNAVDSKHIASLEEEMHAISSKYDDNSDEEWSSEDAEKVSKLIKIILKHTNCEFHSWGGRELRSNVFKYGNKCGVLDSYEHVHRTSFKFLFEITKDIYSDDIRMDIIDVISKFLMTVDAFFLFRKIWSPQGHSSQNDSTDEHISYMEKMLLVMYEEKQKRLIDYDDNEKIVIITVNNKIKTLKENIIGK